jgi:hypothetical protein
MKEGGMNSSKEDSNDGKLVRTYTSIARWAVSSKRSTRQRTEAGAGARGGGGSCGVFFPFATTCCYSGNGLHMCEGVSDWVTSWMRRNDDARSRNVRKAE